MSGGRAVCFCFKIQTGTMHNKTKILKQKLKLFRLKIKIVASFDI